MTWIEAQRLMEERKNLVETDAEFEPDSWMPTVEIVSEPSDTGLSVTPEGVYYGARLIEGAEPSAVERFDLSDKVLLNQYGSERSPYWRDQDSVYFGSLQLLNVDPDSFELFATHYFPRLEARDQNYVYKTGLIAGSRATVDFELKELEFENVESSN